MRKQPTGEPDAGDPHVRFGGEGASAPLPNPDGDGTRVGLPVDRTRSIAAGSPSACRRDRPAGRHHGFVRRGRPGYGHSGIHRLESRLSQPYCSSDRPGKSRVAAPALGRPTGVLPCSSPWEETGPECIRPRRRAEEARVRRTLGRRGVLRAAPPPDDLKIDATHPGGNCAL